MKPIIMLVIGLSLATVAASEEPPRFSAYEVVKRAEVGTFSRRLSPPVRVRIEDARNRQPVSQRFERMTCRPDPVRPLLGEWICRYPARDDSEKE